MMMHETNTIRGINRSYAHRWFLCERGHLYARPVNNDRAGVLSEITRRAYNAFSNAIAYADASTTIADPLTNPYAWDF